MKTRICTVLLTLPLLLGCYGCSARASYLIAEAQYPEMAPYPNEQAYTDPITGEWDDEGFSAAYNAWRESRKAQRSQPEGYTEGVEAFTHLAAKAFLAEEQGKNGVISPLNLYLALGMLAEVTDGASREQILSVLQADSIETLRSRAESLWNANYNRDGALTSVLAASLWLDEDLSYHTAPLDALTKVYRASAYRGQMGDPAYDEALRAWLKAQTGGLLDSQIDGLSMSPENILTLASTVYYQAKWKNEYSEANTKKGIFYSPAGEVVCDFMHRSGTDAYYWSTHYGAISRQMEGGGAMWLILPDEGVDPYTVLAEDAMYRMVTDEQNWTDKTRVIVNQAVPKFDVAGDQDLRPGMAALGITDVMDSTKADFTPLTDLEGTYLSHAKHAVRVAIDEEGVTAASFVVMMEAGAAMPPKEEIDFVLNRPFIFVITGTDNVPLFLGVVNTP